MGKTYVSPSGTAQKVEKIYFGNSNNKAQIIRKAYVGDSNNIARKIFEYNPMPNPLYLIQNGAYVNNNYSGGWQGRALVIIGWSAYAPTLTEKYNNGTNSKPDIVFHINLSSKSNDQRGGIAEIKNDIDLTSYNSIKVYGYATNAGASVSGGVGRLCVINRSNNSVIKTANILTSKNTYTLDISDLTGAYDICIALRTINQSSAYNTHGYFNNLWLE